MPLHLPATSRRDFLRSSLAGAASLLTLQALYAEEQKRNADHWVLLSDPHIAADPATVTKEANMADNLRAAVGSIASLAVAPAGVLVNGDCALDRGLPEDYATFTQLLKPLVDSGLPIHLTLGNHDDREAFWTALKDTRPATPAVASKHVSVVGAGRVNWFMLDSLEVTKQTPGRLGDEQRAWLAKALDAHADKPALVMVHHDPVLVQTEKKAGLLDTVELLEILVPRRHVKALLFGHTHTWKVTEHEGLHLINLPALAYPFKAGNLTGWADCRLRDNGMSLEIHANDQKHPEHGKVSEFAWRAA
ncbi:metallophosphoesterase family protein [Verrucomicrobiota bacterium sgz303538]